MDNICSSSGINEYAFLDNTRDKIHICEINESDKHQHYYSCIKCGGKLTAKTGRIKVWHFAHKPGVFCDGESYLHKLAKERIKSTFDRGVLNLRFACDEVCEIKECPYVIKTCKRDNEPQKINLKEHYSRCDVEDIVHQTL